MYCPLKEAYRIPDFDSAAKKRKGCGAQGNTPAEANDAYFPEAGRGEAARYNASFTEGFENNNKLPESREKIAYRAQAPDYDYYCRSYGVCPETKVEGFQNAAPLQAQNPRAKNQQCSPPTPQRYEVPISPESRAAYDQALKTSLEQGSRGMTAPYVPEKREVDMEKVSGYYDEDLEQYLQTTTWKSAPTTTPITRPEKKPFNPQADDYTDTPFTRAQQYFEKVGASASSSTSSPAPVTYSMMEKTLKAPAPKYGSGSSSWQNTLDLLIFIMAGVLIIVICEQLFKVAMMVGMRRTIDILEPFLDAKRIVG